MKKLIIALAASTSIYALIGCSTPESAQPPTAQTASAHLETDTDRCVRFRERAHHCRAALVDPWVRARAQSRPDVAKMLQSPEGYAELRATALAEFEADGSGPLAPRRARCAAVAERLPDSLRGYTVEMETCAMEDGCAAWAKCVVPVFEQMLAAAGSAPRR